MSPHSRQHASIAVLAAGLAAAGPLVAHAGALSVLHSFSGADGAAPMDGLIVGTGGYLLGATSGGGAASQGTVFKLGLHGVYTVLHSFQGGADGATPNGGVIQNAHGVLFGTTTSGGAHGAGTVYSVQGTRETVLYSFGSAANDGSDPRAGLVMDKAGNLYGTTTTGGTSNAGTVYELVAPTTAGGAWKEQVLYSFGGGKDGVFPIGRVAFDASGALLGTTSGGGAAGYGTVFELQRDGAVWTETILHNFQNTNDGNTPYAGLTMDRYGNFYGAATAGGTSGGGTLFELTRSNTHYVFSVLASVPGSGVSGTYRDVRVISPFLIYATTHCDGNGSGSIYQLTRTLGGPWSYKLLYNFTGGSDGYYSISNLVLEGGVLYGTTLGGGAGSGTVYGFTP